MDEKSKKAFELAEYMTVLANQKNILTEEFNQKLVYYEFGGMFTLSKEFLSFLHFLISQNQIENIILIDDNGTPVCILNLNDFLNKVLSAYVEATNEYYTKYTKLISQRNVEKLINLNE